MSAKLFVPLGSPLHASGGDTSSPSHGSHRSKHPAVYQKYDSELLPLHDRAGRNAGSWRHRGVTVSSQSPLIETANASRGAVLDGRMFCGGPLHVGAWQEGAALSAHRALTMMSERVKMRRRARFHRPPRRQFSGPDLSSTWSILHVIYPARRQCGRGPKAVVTRGGLVLEGY